MIDFFKKQSKVHLYLVMGLSFVLASMLNVYPLSGSFALLRPMWLMMLLVFWLIFQPSLVGVGIACLIGLTADFLMDSRLGQQAFCAIIMTFFVKFVSGYFKRLSAGVVWLLASICLFIYQSGLIILHFLLQGIFMPQLWLATLVSILVWPLLLLTLSRYTV